MQKKSETPSWDVDDDTDTISSLSTRSPVVCTLIATQIMLFWCVDHPWSESPIHRCRIGPVVMVLFSIGWSCCRTKLCCRILFRPTCLRSSRCTRVCVSDDVSQNEAKAISIVEEALRDLGPTIMVYGSRACCCVNGAITHQVSSVHGPAHV